MVDSAMIQQIIEQLSRFPPELQKKVYDFTLAISRSYPKGTPGVELLHLAGTIPADDIEAMAKAIEEGCEQVNANEW